MSKDQLQSSRRNNSESYIPRRMICYHINVDGTIAPIYDDTDLHILFRKDREAEADLAREIQHFQDD